MNADTVIKIAAVVAAVLTIYGAAVKIIKPLNQLVKRFGKLEDQNRENYLSLLRLTISSEEMPLEERIRAGDKYINLGGNGAVRHKYQQLIEQLDKEVHNGQA